MLSNIIHFLFKSSPFLSSNITTWYSLINDDSNVHISIILHYALRLPICYICSVSTFVITKNYVNLLIFISLFFAIMMNNKNSKLCNALKKHSYSSASLHLPPYTLCRFEESKFSSHLSHMSRALELWLLAGEMVKSLPRLGGTTFSNTRSGFTHIVKSNNLLLFSEDCVWIDWSDKSLLLLVMWIFPWCFVAVMAMAMSLGNSDRHKIAWRRVTHERPTTVIEAMRARETASPLVILLGTASA